MKLSKLIEQQERTLEVFKLLQKAHSLIASINCGICTHIKDDTRIWIKDFEEIFPKDI